MQVHKRLALLVAGVAAAFVVGPACNRIAGLDDDLETDLQYYCAPVNGAIGYWENGDQRLILGPNGGHSQVCLCMTEEEYWDEVNHDWFNDEAYLTCLADAERDGFASHNCEETYDEGVWRGQIHRDPESVGNELELCLGVEPEDGDSCNVE